MSRKLLLITIAILLLPFSGICETRRIGIVLPITGKAAIAGEAVRNGALMANEALGNPFEILFEDNALDNSRTLTSVRKLIDTDKVESVVIYASGPSNAAAPIAEQAQVPMIGLSVDPNVSRSRKWVMIHWASNELVAEKIHSELSRRKLKKIAIVTTQVQGNLDLENTFLRSAESRGIEIVFKEEVLPSETEFATIVAKMRSVKPAAVFLDLYYGQAGVFARQCAKQGFIPQFFGHFVLDDDSEVAAAQGALNGAFFASTSAGDLTFDQEYRKKFNKRPALGAIAAYDVVTLLAQAFRSTGGQGTEINNYLHSIRNFSGKTGKYAALPNNSFGVPAGLGEIKDGKITKLPE